MQSSEEIEMQRGKKKQTEARMAMKSRSKLKGNKTETNASGKEIE